MQDLEGDTSPESVLARFASTLTGDEFSASLWHEGRRGLVNIFATAFTGCHEDAIRIMHRAEAPYAAQGHCTVIGWPEHLNALQAMSLNAAASNIFDFDDTHEATIIHPSAPVFPALFALAEERSDAGKPIPGRDLLRAFILGCEVECRIGNAMSPGHYARGWHITSTCGIFGATVATGHLLGLSAEQMRHALAAASAQSAGLVETLGTMPKSVSMGNAAKLGYLSARMAELGLTGPVHPLSGTRGYARVFADEPLMAALTDGLGNEWEASKNTYKPYPVGVVLNPVIEAVLEMRASEGVRLDDLDRVELVGHPLLRERTDRPNAATGRETQVSAQHAVAIALMRGCAGLSEFGDAAATETLAAGRPTVGFEDSETHGVDSVTITLHLKDGTLIRRHIDHAAGSRARPLSDAALEAKFMTAADGAAFTGDVPALLEALWQIDKAADASAIIRRTRAAQ